MTDRDTAERALQALNDDRVCRKCGAKSDAEHTAQHQMYAYPANTIRHGMMYNRATDRLDITCWRCQYQWSCIPEDRQPLT